MAVLSIKAGTTTISGATVVGDFSYFSGNTTQDLGPSNITGFYAGIDAPDGGYVVYALGGPSGVTARVANNSDELNVILTQYGVTGATPSSIFVISGNTSAPTYTIGQAALGGIIAYINGGGTSGTSGLVATVADVSTGAVWGCQGDTITGADGTAIGTGNQNTIDIMAGCPTAGIAARLCGDLIEGGYNDWYLPSKDELNVLYTNRIAIGGFDELAYYWSSSEDDSDFAWGQYFGDGNQGLYSKGNPPNNVRAIRSF